MESHEAGFPPLPHSLEIPSGFPHSHGLDDWIYVFSCPIEVESSPPQGACNGMSQVHSVTHVPVHSPLSARSLTVLDCEADRYKGGRCGREKAR